MLGDATAASHPGGLTRPRDWIRVNRATARLRVAAGASLTTRIARDRDAQIRRLRNSGSGSLASQTVSNHLRSSRPRGPAAKST